MPSACLLCGSPTTDGLVCERCDRRRRAAGKTEPARATTAPAAVEIAAASRNVTEPATIEREISELLRVVSVPVAVFGADRRLTFFSSDAKTMLAIDDPRPSIEDVEKKIGRAIKPGERVDDGVVTIAGEKVVYSILPLSSGGAAVALRRERPAPEGDSETSLSYITQTVLAPLRALQDALRAAAANRNGDPILDDAASTIDQIFASLELSPLSQGGEAKSAGTPGAQVVRRVGERFARLAELKKVRLQVDVASDSVAAIHDQEAVQNVLVTLMENSLHYVPSGGQIVIGLRTLEQKGKQQALLFVMDNGPLVPTEMRETIFANDFVWDPSGIRSGRGLADARRFAQSRGGQLWVEAKNGKTCTFFLRLPAAT